MMRLPIHPTPPLPLFRLSEILSSLFSLPSFFSEIHRKALSGSWRNPVTENKKEKSCGGKNTMSSLLLSLCHYVPLWEVTEEHVCKPVITHLLIPPVLWEKKQQSSCQYFDFQEKNNIYMKRKVIVRLLLTKWCSFRKKGILNNLFQHCVMCIRCSMLFFLYFH